MIYYKLKYIFEDGHVIEIPEIFDSLDKVHKEIKGFYDCYENKDCLGVIVTKLYPDSWFIPYKKMGEQ